ncbi:bifunctional heptose 7-phosphate kinase/heptose 1-phosphate adenyltransferase [Nocardia donostiensis]|uniref:D-glycero-beta-D-manno-heptose 1-phosphate adenylyltransferase n=1 Tax=Nocardia donostiensis TaxID=1538463 RepID=UPI0009EFD443|nr:D-glycero-beta-D-manno-heptose 1-phosphate adenylyltransferase [Nocardia donostiensis]OQS13007.1 bifunctional heptose 7-phosphate kinase/heptose 1-phosphate adenyltransferase [Nocardia donostiensis]
MDSPNDADPERAGLAPDAVTQLASTRPRIVVLGDAVLDVWMWGHSDRLCREAPVPVVEVERTAAVPGAAANTAANLAALGADARLVALAGDDTAAAALRTALTSAGVDATRVHICPGRTTTRKSRVASGAQILIRYDEGRPAPADESETAALLAHLDDALVDADALVVCDYAGALNEDLRRRLAEQRDRLPLLIVDTHHPTRWRAVHPDLVTPNAGEAADALGLADAGLPAPGGNADRVELFDRNRDRLFEVTGSRVAVVTLDRDGTVLLDGDRPAHRTWAQPVPDGQSAGAGDTFVAALTLALVSGMPLTSAVELAQAAADVVVHRPGTAVCTTGQLTEQLDRSSGAVLSQPRLRAAVREHRAAGRRIVFTNGCFDVLHAGHIAYLNEAKRLGDVLVVAVNSDHSVRRLKGEDRPVNPDHDRCAVLAALSCVDHVTVFAEDTPAELLRALEPDLYVKGGDYRPEMLPETPVVRGYGGEVRVLSYLADHSTSAMIERIRANTTAGGAG